MALRSLSDLESFVAVIETGSLTAAARRQGVTVNAVSRRLQQLEDALGVQLLERTTRRSAPTEAGRRLYDKSRAITDALLDAEAAVRRSRDEAVGLVRISMPPVAATPDLLDALAATMAEHPGLAIELRVTRRELPGEGGVDLAVLVAPPPDTHGLVARRVPVQPWCLAAAPSYTTRRGLPRVPGDLAKHACLRFSGDGPQASWTLHGPRGRAVTAPVGGAFESDDSRVLGDALYAGLGIGVRPTPELARGVAAGTLVAVLPRWRFALGSVYLVTTPGRRALGRVAVVAEVVARAVRGPS